MKASIILVGASAAIVASQATFPNGFPECGQVCITNMMNQADNFGCGVDPVCLCTKADFVYGIRDCSNEYCQDAALAAQVVNYGSQYCADAGIAISGIPGNTASATVPASTTVLATATTTGPFTGGLATGSETASAVPIATSEIVSVITSGDSVITSTIGTTTILSTPQPSTTGSGVAGGIVSTITSGDQVITTTIPAPSSSGLSTAVSSVLTTTNSAGETATSAVPTEAPSSEGGESSTEAPSPSETSSEGGESGAQQTAAPLGVVAVVGLAALLL